MPTFRPDRFASVHLFHPLTRCMNRKAAGRIPILMYHAIENVPSYRSPYYETSTSPYMFARHMKFLSENGYETVTLEQAIAAFDKPLGERRPIVLTFDDGYRSVYTNACPILRAYGFTGTVFLISGLTGDRRMQFREMDCLTWSEAREMQQDGMSIGSHTATHPVLAALSRAAIDRELGRSKAEIEDHLGRPVKSFSYPFAFPEANSRLVSCLAGTLEKYGYENGVSTTIGTAGPGDPRYFLPRLPANTCDDMRLFQAKLEGAYDWLRYPQHVYKQLKHRLAGRHHGPSRSEALEAM